MPRTTFEYSTIPARVAADLARPEDLASQDVDVEAYADVEPRPGDVEGGTEVLDGVVFTHHFVDVDGDHDLVRFHWAECGRGEPIVFLHGIPESWYQWHHQMAALSATHRCVAVDLKGYGQSEKKPGDYRHEGAAEQLVLALDAMGVDRFTLVTHDRGTVQGDYIAAAHPDRVVRYGRGEQHLYHFHPDLAPQGAAFAEAPRTGMFDVPYRFIVPGYAQVGGRSLPEEDMRRIIQEFSYPDCTRAVPRYFNSATFRQEWLDRRERLLAAWRCPVMILQGYHTRTQPREFYEHARDYIPNAPAVEVRFLDSAHFWPLETPDEVTHHLRDLVAM